MIQTVTSALKEKGVAEENIKFELFTSTATENKDAGSHSGQTKITVIVDGETTHFEMNQKDTLLDASLKKGIDAPYSCQGGVCSSCLARITKGSAEMKKNSILTDQEIAEGLTLTCQAHPTSAEIEVDFDDV
jgi:ring-1,2-phenylacetyl-CoA epoxidase subunit PaaE